MWLQRFSGFSRESRAKVSPDTFSCWGGTGHGMVPMEPSHSEQQSEAEKIISDNGLRKLIWGHGSGCSVWSCSDRLTVPSWLTAVSARGKAEGFVCLLKSNITRIFGRAWSRISTLQWRRKMCKGEISCCTRYLLRRSKLTMPQSKTFQMSNSVSISQQMSARLPHRHMLKVR